MTFAIGANICPLQYAKPTDGNGATIYHWKSGMVFAGVERLRTDLLSIAVGLGAGQLKRCCASAERWSLKYIYRRRLGLRVPLFGEEEKVEFAVQAIH